MRLLDRIRKKYDDERIARLERELKQRSRDLIDVEQDLEAAKARIRVLEDAARRRNGTP